MNIDWFGLITAVSTALGAVYAFLAYRMSRAQAAPYISSHVGSAALGRSILYLRIHPAPYELRFHRISIEGGLLSEGVFADQDPRTGDVRYGPSHEPGSSSIALDLTIPPLRISTESVDPMFFITGKPGRSTFRISLHSSLAFFPIRYTHTVTINKSTD